MPLVRPRLTDHHGIAVAQAACDFAIPLLDEDLPLYVDPFLLWKSPSLQDQALHGAIVSVFDRLLGRYMEGDEAGAIGILVSLSECPEVGLGLSAKRAGRRIGVELAGEILSTLAAIPQVVRDGIRHIEAVQLLVPGIGTDRVSDLACSILKSFLVDFTVDQCQKYGIPTEVVAIPEVMNHADLSIAAEAVSVPVWSGLDKTDT